MTSVRFFIMWVIFWLSFIIVSRKEKSVGTFGSLYFGMCETELLRWARGTRLGRSGDLIEGGSLLWEPIMIRRFDGGLLFILTWPWDGGLLLLLFLSANG